EIGGEGKKMKRKSTAKGSVDNVLTVIRTYLKLDPRNYDIHLNFPGGTPIDGPSAGIAIMTAVYSAVTGIAIDSKLAMTGEVSIRGDVKPVGGVPAKIEAAIQAGIEKVFIPIDNWQENFADLKAEIIPVRTVKEVIDLSLNKTDGDSVSAKVTAETKLLIASSTPKKGSDCTC
ncbi:MAG TPA: ATP-dependent protease LonB, partial [Clostridiales bacterium]|nr:ATP-dependent protease LonB [Clostridiales bacterium]